MNSPLPVRVRFILPAFSMRPALLLIRRRLPHLIFCAAAALAGGATPAQAQPVVSGVVQWAPTDSTLLPVRFAAVHLVDARHGVVLDTARTDGSGAYRIPLVWPGVSSVIVRVRTESPFANVVGLGSGRPFEASSTARAVSATARIIKVPPIVAPADTVNQAFSVMGAIEYGAEFRRGLAGAAPPRVEVVFPDTGKKSSFDGTRLYVAGVNARDWDVVLHEYGHYVAKLDGMAERVLGDHFLDRPIAGEKKRAIMLAWAEGWASWFSISAQREAALAKLGIPRVGDPAYNDATEAGLDALHLNEPTPPWSHGERSEVAVMRVLYDLADESDPKQPEHVQMGVRRLWEVLRPGHPSSLWDAWNLLGTGLSAQERVQAAWIMEAHAVTPVPRQPAGDFRLRGARPSFTWKGKSMESYVLTVFGPGDTVLLRTPPLTKDSFTPSSAQWDPVRAAAGGGTVWWQVEGRPSGSPSTGPYVSSRRALVP